MASVVGRDFHIPSFYAKGSSSSKKAALNKSLENIVSKASSVVSTPIKKITSVRQQLSSFTPRGVSHKIKRKRKKNVVLSMKSLNDKYGKESSNTSVSEQDKSAQIIPSLKRKRKGYKKADKENKKRNSQSPSTINSSTPIVPRPQRTASIQALERLKQPLDTSDVIEDDEDLDLPSDSEDELIEKKTKLMRATTPPPPARLSEYEMAVRAKIEARNQLLQNLGIGAHARDFLGA